VVGGEGGQKVGWCREVRAGRDMREGRRRVTAGQEGGSIGGGGGGGWGDVGLKGREWMGVVWEVYGGRG